MIQIREIDHVVLRVRQLQDVTDFYCDVLGCRVEKRQPSLGLTQLRAGNCLIDLVDIDGELGRVGGAAPGIEGLNMHHLCLRIDPFDADMIKAHLSDFGVDCGELHSRYGAEGHGPSFYITDPQGNTIELKGPPDLPSPV